MNNHNNDEGPEFPSAPFLMSLLFQCDVIVVAGFGDKKFVILRDDDLFWWEVQKELRFFATPFRYHVEDFPLFCTLL